MTGRAPPDTNVSEHYAERNFGRVKHDADPPEPRACEGAVSSAPGA